MRHGLLFARGILKINDMLDYKKLRKQFSKLLKSHDRNSLKRLFDADMKEERISILTHKANCKNKYHGNN